MPRLLQALLLTLFSDFSQGVVVKETLVISEWVVDFLRPTADITGRFPWQRGGDRKTPFHLQDAVRSAKYLINGSYPGPTIRANENDLLELTVVNKLFSEATTIHWQPT